MHYPPYFLKTLHDQHVKDLKKMMQPWQMPQIPQFLRKFWTRLCHMIRTRNSRNQASTTQSTSPTATQEVATVTK